LSDLEEADAWYESAVATFKSGRGREKFTVAVAQAIHALIKANDALTTKYLGKRSTRHEEAAALFGDLIKSNKIDPKFSELRRLLSRAVAEKSDFDYKGVDVSQATAARWLREIEGFLRAVHKILGK